MSSPEQPPPPVARQARWFPSNPTFASGACRCGALNYFEPNLPFSDNRQIVCAACGAKMPRLNTIREALARRFTYNWGLFASDGVVRDDVDLAPGQMTVYDLSNFGFVKKWQHHESWPTGVPPEAGSASLQFFGTSAYLTAFRPPGPNNSEPVHAGWSRFAVTNAAQVPAWRQSLYGAYSLLPSYPSAAIVLLAAAFESFFMETMGIHWRQAGMDPVGFRRLADSAPNISNVVGWLPEAVGVTSFKGSHLSSPWQKKVNARRNDVVHKANVEFTEQEADESLRVVLECITIIDHEALVRPHRYYLPESTIVAKDATDDAEATNE